MTTEAGSPSRIARVLSATLQALVAEQVGGDSVVSSAFLMEFVDDLSRARLRGAFALIDAYEDLIVDLSGALLSVTKYQASSAGQDPNHALEQLIRTYRKATTT